MSIASCGLRSILPGGTTRPHNRGSPRRSRGNRRPNTSACNSGTPRSADRATEKAGGAAGHRALGPALPTIPRGGGSAVTRAPTVHPRFLSTMFSDLRGLRSGTIVRTGATRLRRGGFRHGVGGPRCRRSGRWRARWANARTGTWRRRSGCGRRREFSRTPRTA